MRTIDIHAHWYPEEWLRLFEKDGPGEDAKLERSAKGYTASLIFGAERDQTSQGTSNDGRLTFKKGGAALLDVPGAIEDGGSLLWYLTPRILRQLGR